MASPCLTSTRKAQIETRIAEYEARKALADTYYAQILAGEGIESGKFDSGEAMSWWKYTDPSQFLIKVISPIDQYLDYLRNQLNGTGIVRLNLSRGR